MLDLCLSCKGCKSECPSNVDIAKLKAEFSQHYYDDHGVPLRTKMIANYTQSSRLASLAPWAWNVAFGTPTIRKVLNRIVGFHPDRTIPMLHKTTLEKWHNARGQKTEARETQKLVYLFCDEFTNYNDVPLGQKAIQLLETLGYTVIIPKHLESARTWLSKGLVRKAKEIANANVQLLAPLITEETPLIGIEPSAILTFRDEYIDLADGELKTTARTLSTNCLMFEEFIVRELEAGRIQSHQFKGKEQLIKFHGHCFQKSLASVVPTVRALQIPAGYKVHMIPSGCCGMAGSFGYEKEHYELSMKIGELVLFPAVREQAEDVIIAATGTSCRHQIHDGTKRTALHPAEILFNALNHA